jgi:hypothetical protein
MLKTTIELDGATVSSDNDTQTTAQPSLLPTPTVALLSTGRAPPVPRASNRAQLRPAIALTVPATEQLVVSHSRASFAAPLSQSLSRRLFVGPSFWSGLFVHPAASVGPMCAEMSGPRFCNIACCLGCVRRLFSGTTSGVSSIIIL